MQDKSLEKFSMSDRLRRVRLKLQCTWKELADLIEVTDSMIYQVLKGKKNLSDKAEVRLWKQEVQLGLADATADDLPTELLSMGDLVPMVGPPCRLPEPEVDRKVLELAKRIEGLRGAEREAIEAVLKALGK